MDSDSWKIKWNEVKALRRYGGLFLASFIGVGGSLATTDIIKRHWKKEPSTGQKIDVLKMNTLALHQWLLFLKQDTELVKIDINAIRRNVAKHDFEIRIYLDITEGLLKKRGVPPPLPAK